MKKIHNNVRRNESQQTSKDKKEMSTKVHVYLFAHNQVRKTINRCVFDILPSFLVGFLIFNWEFGDLKNF